jgi:putative transposase
MANTYTQISIHVVFTVKNRTAFISKDWRDQLHEYISGIINNEGCKSLAVGGWKDHIHIFFGLNPNISIADLIRVVKANSSKWINEKKFINDKFQWQVGYGAFSYSKSQRNNVINYIINQESHHQSKSFKEEYLGMLDNFEVEYDDNYLFEFFE